MSLPYAPCPPEMTGLLLPSGSTFFLSDENQWAGLTEAATQSDHPWLILIEALGAARLGDLDATSRLAAAADSFPYADYANACSVLLGAAAPARVLDGLASGETVRSRRASMGLPAAHRFRAMTMTHQLWAVQRVLDQLDLVGSLADRHGLILRCARVLEAGGPYIEDDDAAVDEHAERLRVVAEDLCSAGCSSAMSLLGGEPLTIAGIVDRMLMITETEYELDFALYRVTFEGYTGIDCRHFYVEHRLQKLAAAAILEDFLESGEADRYEPGARYFFGHRIPD